MTQSTLQFQIEQLRAKNLQRTLESLAVFILAIFVSALLPSLLIRYVYAGQQLFEEPQLLQYIPLVSFVVGIAYFIYAVATNVMREMKAANLERELMAGGEVVTRSSDTAKLQAAMERVEASTAKNPARSKVRKSTRRK